MSKLTLPEAAPAGSACGLQFLEQKLAVYVHGTAATRRNPALDVLVGRVPDARLAPLAMAMADTGASAAAPSPSSPDEALPVAAGGLPGPRTPSTVVLPLAAVRMAAVARARRVGSPWLAPDQPTAPRLRLLQSPRESLWLRVRRRLARFLLPEA